LQLAILGSTFTRLREKRVIDGVQRDKLTDGPRPPALQIWHTNSTSMTQSM